MSPVDARRISTEELKAELARREGEEKTPRRPPPLTTGAPDFEQLVKTIVDGFDYAERDGFVSEKLAGYVWDQALEAVYGPGIWDWLKKRFR